jgi:leucyl-tRNA synthetase
LHPFAPHAAEELWERCGFAEPLYGHPWPTWDPEALVVDTVEIAVQVGGKLRGTFAASRTASKDELLAAARAVVDLFRNAGYTTRSNGNLLVLSLEPGAAASSATAVAAPLAAAQRTRPAA